MATIWQRLAGWVERAATRAAPTRRARLAVAEDENSITVGWRWGASDRERQDYTREEILEQALEAWRVNPLARRLVELTTQYVIGSGLRVSVSNGVPSSPALPPERGKGAEDLAERFVKEWWSHPLNQLDLRLSEWCDELTRAGELFLLVSSDEGGMSYVRAVAAEQVLDVVTAENDVQQERAYVVKTAASPSGARHLPWALVPGSAGQEGQVYPSWAAVRGGPPPGLPLKGGGAEADPLQCTAADPRQGTAAVFMLHYAINRPVGTVRGESDLAPVLRWLSRYSGWLEDRARLNRYRNTFLFTVQARFADESERAARQAALALNPPAPGSILVTDESEVWSVLSPQLDSHEAGADGLALKKMIAAGSGVPLHFLAEPESATRTTAEAAGGPTYRRFEQRQRFFCSLLEDLIGVVLELRFGSRQGAGEVKVSGADLSARDNAALAVAGSAVGQLVMHLRDREIIDDVELLRLVYRFLGENADIAEVLEHGRKATPPPAPPRPGEESGKRRRPGSSSGHRSGSSSGHRSGVDGGPDIKVKVDADTGDINVA